MVSAHLERLRDLAPGILFAGVVAAAASLSAVLIKPFFAIPAMIIALVYGIALHQLALRPLFAPGLTFCVKTLLRVAIALLGLRIALSEIVALGLSTAILTLIAMIATLLSGFWFARLFGREAGYGALAGAGTAICGASATLATSTVLPDYKGKEADVAFVVIGVNALSTIAMTLYPTLCLLAGFDETVTGIMLGATIHDVAQVAGAGYAVSETAGNAAVVVKLFRVLLLLPMIVVIGWWFSRQAVTARAPVPVFAFVFVGLCLLNSVMLTLPEAQPFYAPLRSIAVEAATIGLLLAIAALGLGTSFDALGRLGWRHLATLTATTVVILVAIMAGLLFFAQWA